MAQLPGSDKVPSDALRNAIDRTFEATAGSAAEASERVRELLDEVVKRSADAVEGLRDRDEVKRIEAELSSLTDRLEKLDLESRVRRK